MDTHEELAIKKDGSGTLVIKSDLNKMLAMLRSMGARSDMEKEGLARTYDTIVLMKDYVDTARNVAPDQKELLREGKMHIVLNAKENVGKFDMTFPFRSGEKLQQLYTSLNNTSGGLKGLLGNIGKPGPDTEDSDKNMPQLTSVYDITVKDGQYKRTVNQERYEAFTQAIKLEQLTQLSSVMGAMEYTFQITLPRAIKSISNSKAILSSDKKTAILKNDLIETFQHPELLSVEIQY